MEPWNAPQSIWDDLSGYACVAIAIFILILFIFASIKGKEKKVVIEEKEEDL